MPDDQTSKHAYRKRFAGLKREYESWRTHYLDIQRYLMPRKGRYLRAESDQYTEAGQKRHQYIINGSAYDSLRIIAAGMQGGMTSPSRPWFVLALSDEDLMEYAPVKQWLHDVRNTLLTVYSRSNFYGAIHSVYMELAAFGTAVMVQNEDFKTIVRFRPLTVGEYFLATADTGRVDTLYRQFAMTASQMVSAFGESNVSDSVKTAYETNNKDQYFEVRHCIHPAGKHLGRLRNREDFKYTSVYYEESSEKDDAFLRIAGYKDIPFVAPRWDVTATDTYGNSPAMAALGDIMMLQKMEEKKLKALDKMVDPPMNADSALRRQGGTIIAGGVNYIDGMSAGNKGFAPTYQVSPDMQNIAFEIERVERRIRRFFFNDLFLSVLYSNKNMTATEVAERHEEKMLLMGPILERLQAEMLDPIIDRSFAIVESLGLLPPVPGEIAGMDINVEYISLLAQAQKLVGTTSIEQTVNFAANLAAANPDVLDKVDFDESVDQYAAMVGVPPKMIRSDDAVAAIRAQRAQQAAAAQQQQLLVDAASGAKTLADTKLDENSALDAVMENLL